MPRSLTECSLTALAYARPRARSFVFAVDTLVRPGFRGGCYCCRRCCCLSSLCCVCGAVVVLLRALRASRRDQSSDFLMQCVVDFLYVVLVVCNNFWPTCNMLHVKCNVFTCKMFNCLQVNLFFYITSKH